MRSTPLWWTSSSTASAGPHPRTSLPHPAQSDHHLQQTRVAAGTPIKGTGIFTNRTGASILVSACAADGWFDVGLANKRISYSPANPAIACSPMVHLLSGVDPGADHRLDHLPGL